MKMPSDANEFHFFPLKNVAESTIAKNATAIMYNQCKICTNTYEAKREIEIASQFLNVKNSEEAIKIAKDLGYKINEEEIENNKELVENMLESVAGGRTKVKIRNYSFSSGTVAYGKKSDVETSVTWTAGRK